MNNSKLSKGFKAFGKHKILNERELMREGERRTEGEGMVRKQKKIFRH